VIHPREVVPTETPLACAGAPVVVGVVAIYIAPGAGIPGVQITAADAVDPSVVVVPTALTETE
jgi:hypothetical protein